MGNVCIHIYIHIYMMFTYISSIQTLVVMTERCQISHKNKKYTDKYHSEFYLGKRSMKFLYIHNR